jgi:hypothetical protein
VVAAIVGELVFSRQRQLLASKEHLAVARHVESPQYVEQSGFSATGRAEQHEELPRAELEIDAVQCAHIDLAHAIDLAQRLATQHGF